MDLLFLERPLFLGNFIISLPLQLLNHKTAVNRVESPAPATVPVLSLPTNPCYYVDGTQSALLEIGLLGSHIIELLCKSIASATRIIDRLAEEILFWIFADFRIRFHTYLLNTRIDLVGWLSAELKYLYYSGGLKGVRNRFPVSEAFP